MKIYWKERFQVRMVSAPVETSRIGTHTQLMRFEGHETASREEDTPAHVSSGSLRATRAEYPPATRTPSISLTAQSSRDSEALRIPVPSSVHKMWKEYGIRSVSGSLLLLLIITLGSFIMMKKAGVSSGTNPIVSFPVFGLNTSALHQIGQA